MHFPLLSVISSLLSTMIGIQKYYITRLVLSHSAQEDNYSVSLTSQFRPPCHISW